MNRVAHSVLDPHSAQSGRIADLFWLMFGLAAVVYVVVVTWGLVAIWRRPATGGQRAPGGDDRLGRRFIIAGGIAMPIVVLAVVGVATVRVTRAATAEHATVHIEVTGERWWWRVRYPDAAHSDAPVVETANEIHVPVGEPVEIWLMSDNVIHSFWVPELNGKTDLVPGQQNATTFTVDEPGIYRGQCAEFCGIAHALMAFLVIAQPPADYLRWLDDQRAPAAEPPSGVATTGRDLFMNSSCAGCHMIAGTPAVGTYGPDLTHVASRRTLAAVTLENTKPHLAEWLDHTRDVKPGALMPEVDLTQAQIDQLVAYLEGLR